MSYEFKNKRNSDEGNRYEWISKTTKDIKDFKKEADYCYHIYNILYPLSKARTADHVYLFTMGKCLDELDRLVKKHDPEQSLLVQSQMFYKCIEDIEEEDMSYFQNNVRHIKKQELIFILKTICSKIHNDIQDNKDGIVYYGYFLSDRVTTKKMFKEATGRALGRNKLNHIMDVLEKYKLIHRNHIDDRKVEYKVGENNPLYLLEMFPDIKVNNNVELSLPQKYKILDKKYEVVLEALSLSSDKNDMFVDFG